MLRSFPKSFHPRSTCLPISMSHVIHDKMDWRGSRQLRTILWNSTNQIPFSTSRRPPPSSSRIAQLPPLNTGTGGRSAPISVHLTFSASLPLWPLDGAHVRLSRVQNVMRHVCTMYIQTECGFGHVCREEWRVLRCKPHGQQQTANRNHNDRTYAENVNGMAFISSISKQRIGRKNTAKGINISQEQLRRQA